MTPEQRQFLLDVMVTAFEGGCSYWAEARNVQRDDAHNYTHYELRDRENKDEQWRTVTPELIDKVIPRLLNGMVRAPQHIARQFIGYPHNLEDLAPDADAADFVVQVVCYGDIVFS